MECGGWTNIHRIILYNLNEMLIYVPFTTDLILKTTIVYTVHIRDVDVPMDE